MLLRPVRTASFMIGRKIQIAGTTATRKHPYQRYGGQARLCPLIETAVRYSVKDTTGVTTIIAFESDYVYPRRLR
jgi:hypothetical protein